MQLHSFSEAHLLTCDLAAQLKQILCDAVARRGQGYLVVSGGKTPIDLFKILAKMDIPWDKITIILADERCVPIDDSNRNEAMVRRFLLQHDASHAHLLSLFNEQEPTLEGLKAVDQAVAALPTFDAVILGMGEDGHTASLFPCSNEISQGLADNASAVLFVNPKNALHQRVTLSKRRLLDARVIFFHLLGQKKLAVLHQAMVQHDPMVMPVSAFLNNHDANVQVMYAP